VIEILRSTGNDEAADRLEERFLAFIRQSGAKHVIEEGNGDEAQE